MGAVQVHVKYEEQPAFCEYCKESGHETEVSPTDYITNCCKIKLNSKRKSDLCSCVKKFYKCKCGYWYAETKYNDFRCELCDRMHAKCPPTCGRPQYLSKGEITRCNKSGTVYDDTGARLSTETI